MKKRIACFVITCIIACLQPAPAKAQDTTHLRISLLTCTPGTELYSTFGHSALRVTDSVTHNDIVFNYGTFDFEDPDFYVKFVKGKLMYFVSIQDFNEFVYEYQLDKRGITEQLLNLDAAEKTAVKNFLRNNIKEENRYYKYDFLFDNCTTRLRDIIVNSKQTKPAFKNVMPAGTTFRQAIHTYLDKNDKAWDKLGIDILLGAPTDAVMTTEQQQFLPDNLMTAFDSAQTLVVSTASLYPYQSKTGSNSFFNPLVFFSLLLLTVILLDFFRNNTTAAILIIVDFILFFGTGLLGLVLLFMWLGTDHAMCKNNYNLLWAFPLHVGIAFFIKSTKKWVKRYYLITAILLLLTLLGWFFLPQQLNTSLLAVILLLLYRSLRKYQTL